ncbi:hypothetical protein V8G54_010501, partial [Vigna mungo]
KFLPLYAYDVEAPLNHHPKLSFHNRDQYLPNNSHIYSFPLKPNLTPTSNTHLCFILCFFSFSITPYPLIFMQRSNTIHYPPPTFNSFQSSYTTSITQTHYYFFLTLSTRIISIFHSFCI